MTKICPNPSKWHETYSSLIDYASHSICNPSQPPKPLILAGWSFSNDVEKKERWERTVQWAFENGCSDLVVNISESDFYFVEEPTSYVVGPNGGPMYQAWDYHKKTRLTFETISQLMQKLLTNWPEIVGAELAPITIPLKFTGAKARRLLILADYSVNPPWGEWTFLTSNESERRTFTRLRAAINRVLHPHVVDHIDFIEKLDANQ